jgi:hypothetical protein
MGETESSGSFFGKVIGGFFAAIIAPVLTGVAVWYIQKKLDEPKPDAPPNAPAQAAATPTPTPTPTPGDPDAAKSKAKSPSTVPKPPVVKEKGPEKKDEKLAVASTSTTSAPSKSTSRPVATKKKRQLRTRLFNGNDLTGFDTYLGVPDARSARTRYGLNKDPEGVFTVKDGELHVSGKLFGGLVTTREYENYDLLVEYKWGEKKWFPREKLARMCGIVLHATGEPGAVNGWSMAGITCVLHEAGAGSLFLPDGLPRSISFYSEAERFVPKKGGNTLIYKPGESLIPVHTGYVHWIGWRPPVVAAKAAAAGKTVKDVVHPIGEWNRLECICEGDKIVVILNGVTMNVASKVSQTKGKLFIESQGAEISFRTINVRPLTGASPGSTAKSK